MKEAPGLCPRVVHCLFVPPPTRACVALAAPLLPRATCTAAAVATALALLARLPPCRCVAVFAASMPVGPSLCALRSTVSSSPNSSALYSLRLSAHVDQQLDEAPHAHELHAREFHVSKSSSFDREIMVEGQY